jgi:hemolysin III
VPKPDPQPHRATQAEDRASCLTHGVGAALSVAALVVLVSLAALRGNAWHVATVGVFGASMLMVYLASSLYHGCQTHPTKRHLKVLDHVAIYCLIAGTYTPFLLILIGGAWGWSLFGVVWGLAIAGTVFKLFFVDRFDGVSTAVYVGMGWLALVAAKPFMERLPGGAIGWLLAGGVAYTAGVIFYRWDRLPYNHAIWHLFVLAGSACHFIAVLLYVVPS